MSVVVCVHCKREIDPDGASTVRKLSGWVENSKTGRPNKIRESTDMGMYAHVLCYESAKRGFAEQVGLF